MTIRPDDAPLDSDDELADDAPGNEIKPLRRRLAWTGIVAVLCVAALWLFERLGG